MATSPSASVAPSTRDAAYFSVAVTSEMNSPPSTEPSSRTAKQGEAITKQPVGAQQQKGDAAKELPRAVYSRAISKCRNILSFCIATI